MELQCYTVSAFGGLATWMFLNRHAVRGDYALMFFFVACFVVYFYLRALAESTTTASSSLFKLILIYILSASGATICYRLSPWHPLASFPGPIHWRISSLWLAYVSSTGRRHLVLDQLHTRYGPILRIGPNMLSINHASAGNIYSAAAHMEKSDSYLVPGRQPQVTLFFKQPTEKIHNERKRVWRGLFTSAGVTQLYPALEQRTWELLHTMERRQAESPDDSLDLAACLCHWSYDFMGDMVFGGCSKLELMKNGDPSGLVEGGKKATATLDCIGQARWLLDILWHLPVGKDMHQLQAFAAQMMRKRIISTDLPPYRDLVSYLLEDTSIPMSDLELDAVIAIEGGSDGISNAMVFALFCLISEPQYYLKFRLELDANFPDPLGYLDPTKLAALPLLDGAINEALRLGTALFLPRIVPPDGAVIADKFIPGGTIVAVAGYSQQLDPSNYWPEPKNFRPERWLPLGLGPETKTNRQALWAFSAGPHVCIAKAFAYQEIRYALARIILAFDITFADGFNPKSFQEGILRMRTHILKHKLLVNIRRREQAS